MIEVCLLGCGGMMPLPDRRLTALLYRYNGKMILIDCGEGTQLPIKITGWGFKSIEAICFTHYHADHIAGLPGFLLTLGNSGREEPLKIYGPPGLIEVIKALTIIAPELPFETILIELSDENLSTNHIGDIIIKSIPVDHTLSCLSYSIEIRRAGKFDVQRAKDNNIPIKFWSSLQNGKIIEHEGKRYVPEMVLGRERKGLKVTYSTDTRPTGELTDFCKGSDLLIGEGMYGENDQLQKAIKNKHMIFSEAATLAFKSHSKELWLTHYSPSLQNPDLFIDNAKNIFMNTVAGKDLMVKRMNFD